MIKTSLKKGLIITIIVLFFRASILPGLATTDLKFLGDSSPSLLEIDWQNQLHHTGEKPIYTGDFVAEDLWISSQDKDWYKNHVIISPREGQLVYYHFVYQWNGSGSSPTHHFQIKLDTFLLHDIEIGGIQAVWTSGSFLAVTGNHILTGTVDTNNDVTESDESNNMIQLPFEVIPPGPDLRCNGFLNWRDIEAGTQVIGQFTVTNIGNPGTELDWEVTEWPMWGDWTFTPKSSENLTPEAGPLTVHVNVIVPNEKSQEFTGEITIVNKENTEDISTIQVSLTTPKNKQSTQSLLLQFLERAEKHLQILGRLLIFKLAS